MVEKQFSSEHVQSAFPLLLASGTFPPCPLLPSPRGLKKILDYSPLFMSTHAYARLSSLLAQTWAPVLLPCAANSLWEKVEVGRVPLWLVGWMSEGR